MKKKSTKLSLLGLLISMLIFSCERHELPVPKYDRGEAILATVNMSSDYKHQVWYSLDQNKVTSSNEKLSWDLAFESNTIEEHIFLNSSKAMRVSLIEKPFEEVNDTSGFGSNFRVDVSSGNRDSTAIGNWHLNKTKTYIVFAGYNLRGRAIAYYKLQILASSATEYQIRYQKLYGGEEKTVMISKDKNANLTMFSFETGKTLLIEPSTIDYDLCFTQYTHVFTNPLMYYQVTGVLATNRHTRIAEIPDADFEQVALSDSLSFPFKTDADAIGYDWKTFDLNTNIFTINPRKIYLIQDSKGFYYKLHFTDFYNASGEKGNPSFEFMRL